MLFISKGPVSRNLPVSTNAMSGGHENTNGHTYNNEANINKRKGGYTLSPINSVAESDTRGQSSYFSPESNKYQQPYSVNNGNMNGEDSRKIVTDDDQLINFHDVEDMDRLNS